MCELKVNARHAMNGPRAYTTRMHLRWLNAFLLTAALAMGAAACSGSSARPGSAKSNQPPSGSRADTLATEALARYALQRDGARAWTLISSATKQRPADTALAFMQMRLCQLIEGCQPEPYEARVRKLDPENAAVWMRSLADAQQRRDAMVEAQVLDAMGRAQRFDVYWNALNAKIATARIANGARPSGALDQSVDWLGATLIPSLQPVMASCSRVRTAEQPWAERCRRVAGALVNGDTYLAESLGTTLAQQVASEQEQAQLNERARTARYLWRMYAEIARSQIERDKFAAEILELMRKLRREQQVHLAVVRWAGRPVIPRPTWTDEG